MVRLGTNSNDGPPSDRRIDAARGTVVHVVGTRQTRPNLPAAGCPFCPGGLEAPEQYDVRWFRNRWPAMPGERCEVVLYTPDHDATMWSLGVAGVRRVVDLWTERFIAMAARDDVEFVLVFENRGPEVGATIAHPHGQIYAYDHVPERPLRTFVSGWQPSPVHNALDVAGYGTWRASVPHAPIYPVALTLWPARNVADLTDLTDAERDDLAATLVDVLARLDRLFDAPLPYMMWLMQRPTTASAASDFPDARMHIEIVSPWRAAGVPRYIAAAEVACGEYFNPLSPEDLAERLRSLGETGAVVQAGDSV